jgi:hypothetical protein
VRPAFSLRQHQHFPERIRVQHPIGILDTVERKPRRDIAQDRARRCKGERFRDEAGNLPGSDQPSPRLRRQ